MKYLKLLRLQDQYFQFGSAIAAGVYLHVKSGWILLWAIATTCFSIVSFIVNEIVDRQDTDKYSWNGVHVKNNELLDGYIVGLLIVTFSVIGLFIVYSIGLFWWGITILVIGLFYSLKPVRFKARFGWDVLVQELVWWILPFSGPLWLMGKLHANTVILLLTVAFCVWSGFFPYQLADFTADTKAKLKNTHTILGMKKSLWLGIASGIAGLFLFVNFKIYETAFWVWPFVSLVIYAFWNYWKWLQLHSLVSQIHNMQDYVKRVKPLSQLLLPYILVLWIFS